MIMSIDRDGVERKVQVYIYPNPAIPKPITIPAPPAR
jgi:hypothetical protein